MSKITDFAAKEQADFAAESAKLDSVIKGIADLDAAIKALNDSSGSLSVLDQAALDDLQTKSAALLAKVSSIDTTIPVPVPVVPLV